MQNSLIWQVHLCRGFRDRLLADPGFFVKVGIEVRWAQAAMLACRALASLHSCYRWVACAGVRMPIRVCSRMCHLLIVNFPNLAPGGIGIFTKSTAEYSKRGENFSKVRDCPS